MTKDQCDSKIRGMTREAFISEHVQTCNASARPKYDSKKATGQFHSLEYSRRKCAKEIWRKANRQASNANQHNGRIGL